MNLFVADPEWGWWIVLYFFLGGIAAGAYFTATLITLVGTPADQTLARWGFRVALPLIALCGLFLIVDLNRPERFWHMLVRSEVVRAALDAGWPFSGRGWGLMVQAPLVKHWSPMSIGSWALTLFGLCSAASFLGALWPGSRLEGWLIQGVAGRAFQVIGCLVGFFIASYTGALLTATNQPVWSDSTWIAPLFLTSAASTGIATVLLLSRGANPGSLERLRHADLWALGAEAVVLAVFLGTLGGAGLGQLWSTGPGKAFLVGVPALGLVLPAALHLTQDRAGAWGIPAAAVLSLLGGFLLRYTIVTTPSALLAQGPGNQPAAATVGTPDDGLVRFSPEDARPRGGGPGGDPGNYPANVGEVQPRTKFRPEG